jgi:hypothetical protein
MLHDASITACSAAAIAGMINVSTSVLLMPPPSLPLLQPSAVQSAWIRAAADLILDDREYTEVFDALEVLLGVILTDLRSEPNDSYVPGPWYGAVTWRDRHARPTPEQQLLDRLRAKGDAAPEVQAGLFGGSGERAIHAAETFAENSVTARAQRW